MSISFAPELGDAVREAAERSGVTLSAWLAEAARAKLRAEEDEQEAHEHRIQGLNAFLDEWEAEHGAFTEEELTRAARKLGVPWPPKPKEEDERHRQALAQYLEDRQDQHGGFTEEELEQAARDLGFDESA
jgi:hypothetical protein